jgi:hypothetical protein
MKYLLATAAILATIGAASADSCWTHNGSLMRLRAYADSRSIVYEVPRHGLSAIGIRRGTELFNGTSDGESYSGTAVVFTPFKTSSGFLANDAVRYNVSGPIHEAWGRGGRQQIVLYDKETGQPDLVFNYSSQC